MRHLPAALFIAVLSLLPTTIHAAPLDASAPAPTPETQAQSNQALDILVSRLLPGMQSDKFKKGEEYTNPFQNLRLLYLVAHALQRQDVIDKLASYTGQDFANPFYAPRPEPEYAKYLVVNKLNRPQILAVITAPPRPDEDPLDLARRASHAWRTGHKEAAFTLIDEALKRSPYNGGSFKQDTTDKDQRAQLPWLILTLVLMNRQDEAAALFDRAAASPNSSLLAPHLHDYFRIAAATGRLDKAIAAVETKFAQAQHDTIIQSWVLAQALQGKQDSALAEVARRWPNREDSFAVKRGLAQAAVLNADFNAPLEKTLQAFASNTDLLPHTSVDWFMLRLVQERPDLLPQALPLYIPFAPKRSRMVQDLHVRGYLYEAALLQTHADYDSTFNAPPFQKLAQLGDLPALESLLTYAIKNMSRHSPPYLNDLNRFRRHLQTVKEFQAVQSPSSLKSMFQTGGFSNTAESWLTRQTRKSGPLAMLQTIDKANLAPYELQQALPAILLGMLPEQPVSLTGYYHHAPVSQRSSPDFEFDIYSVDFTERPQPPAIPAQ